MDVDGQEHTEVQADNGTTSKMKVRTMNGVSCVLEVSNTLNSADENSITLVSESSCLEGEMDHSGLEQEEDTPKEPKTDIDGASDVSGNATEEPETLPGKVVKRRVTRKRKRKFTAKSTRNTRTKKPKEVEESVVIKAEEPEPETEDQATEKSEVIVEIKMEEPKDEKEKKLVVELEHDTEMVSEDEFPNDNTKAPLETEAVSDEELPTSAIDTLETEAVSEDELPIEAKKKKTDSPAVSEDDKSNSKDENELLDIKPSQLENASESPKSKKQSTDSSKSCNALPELEKYWKAVENDVTDFSGWTYLLQYVDQENNVEAARKAYDSFLKHYPYCYGYWRKYADYERRKGDKSKCEEQTTIGSRLICATT